jgi:hypothetical protein
MSTEQSTLSTTIMVIDPDTIRLDSRGRFEMSEIIDISLLDSISGGLPPTKPISNSGCPTNQKSCPITINVVAHCGG